MIGYQVNSYYVSTITIFHDFCWEKLVRNLVGGQLSFILSPFTVSAALVMLRRTALATMFSRATSRTPIKEPIHG
jgi:hypothetical protein